MRELDKLEGITLSLETPSFVLQEIAISRGIIVSEEVNTNEVYRSKVFASIQNVKSYSISYPYTETDLSKIALFINPNEDVEWDEDALVSAFLWTCKVSRNIELVETLSYGYPVPNNTKSVSHLYLYRYLVSKNIRMKHNTTKQELERIAKYLKFSDEYLVSFVQSRLPLQDKYTLSFLASFLDKRYENRKDLSKLKEIVEKNIYVQHPLSQEEAIALAAKNYSTDISSFEDPLFVYHKLMCKEFPPDNYSKRLTNSKPSSYRVDTYFNPYFPISLYEPEDLSKLCTEDGLQRTTSSEVNYSILQTSYTIERFHLGLIPGSNLSTFVYEHTVEEVNNKLLLTYGSVLTNWTTYSVDELVEGFKEHQFFYDPMGGVFEKDAVHSLITLSKKMSSRMVTNKDVRKSWKELYDLIVIIKEKLYDIDKYCTNLRNYYSKCTGEDKQRIIKILKNILYLGFYSRGYKDGEELPIWKVPEYNNDNVEILSGDKLYELMTYLKDKDCDKRVLNLPLLKVEPKSHNIFINYDYQEGLVIHDRLKSMSLGKQGSIKTCVRTSSSFLIASAYTYLKALGVEFKEDFGKIKIVL